MASLQSQKPSLKDVCNELRKVAYNWFTICVQLGVPHHKLKEFEKNDDPLTAAIDYWLSENIIPEVPTTWTYLGDALDRAGENGTAKAIRKKYCGGKGESDKRGVIEENSTEFGSNEQVKRRKKKTQEDDSPVTSTKQSHSQPVTPAKQSHSSFFCSRQGSVILIFVVLLIGSAIWTFSPQINAVLAPSNEKSWTTEAQQAPNSKQSAPSNEKSGEPQQAPDSKQSDCHKIESSTVLEKYLKEIDTEPEILCDRLEITDCLQLKHDKNLKPFYLAKKYLSQRSIACWEDIVNKFCKMDEKLVAGKVTEEQKLKETEC